MTRLALPNGIRARVSPNGRWVTCGNEFCDVAELETVNGQVQVKPGSFRRLPAGGQAYAGYWWKPDSLLWWHDEPGQRYRHVYNPFTGESTTKPAHGSYFYARDGQFVEQSADQLWLNSGPVAGTAGIGPATLCEGWMLYPTDQTNGALKLTTPDWAHAFVRVGSSNLHVCGPGVATSGDLGTFQGWSPANYTIPTQIQPPGARFPWGEVPDWCWRRPDGAIWLASHVLEQPNGQSYVLLRPFGSRVPTWLPVPPLDYLSLADDGQRIRLVGSYNADAWAIDVPLPWPPPVV